MSGSLAAIITIPIVVVIVLFSWVAAVIYAESHPRWKHQLPPPRTEVAGGSFRALAGGRQVMPIPEEPPAGVPGQRAATGDEYYETAVREHAASARASEPAGASGVRAGTGQPPG